MLWKETLVLFAKCATTISNKLKVGYIYNVTAYNSRVMYLHMYVRVCHIVLVTNNITSTEGLKPISSAKCHGMQFLIH